MSPITTLESVRSRTAGPLHFLRTRVGSWGLVIALLALPVYYGLHDLISGYQIGFAQRTPGHPPRPLPARLQPAGGALERRHLGADRDRLHARLRDHRADQLRPRRRLHDGLVHGRRAVGRARDHGHHGAARPGFRTGADADPHDAHSGVAERPDRARRLPAAAQRSEARAADHGRRLLVRAAERRPAVAGRQPGLRLRPGPPGRQGLQHLRRDRASGRRARDRADDPARARSSTGSSTGLPPAAPCARPRRIPRPRG